MPEGSHDPLIACAATGDERKCHFSASLLIYRSMVAGTLLVLWISEAVPVASDFKTRPVAVALLVRVPEMVSWFV